MECECAKENAMTVSEFLHNALETLHYVVIDSASMLDYTDEATKSRFRSISTNTSFERLSFYDSLKQFESIIDLSRHNMIPTNSNELDFNNNLIVNTLNELMGSIEDFIDSLFISNHQRERIIHLKNEIRDDTLAYLKAKVAISISNSATTDEDEDASLSTSQQQHQSKHKTNSTKQKTSIEQKRVQTKPNIIQSNCHTLHKLLNDETNKLTNSLFRDNLDVTLLNLIRSYSDNNNNDDNNTTHYDLFIETLDKFKEYSDHVLEVK
jgi:hypothetical protein